MILYSLSYKDTEHPLYIDNIRAHIFTFACMRCVSNIAAILYTISSEYFSPNDFTEIGNIFILVTN